MNIDKIHEARRLVEQMLAFGDAPCGLAAVARLLDEAMTNDNGEDEMVWIDREPPAFGIVRPPA